MLIDDEEKWSRMKAVLLAKAQEIAAEHPDPELAARRLASYEARLNGDLTAKPTPKQ